MSDDQFIASLRSLISPKSRDGSHAVSVSAKELSAKYNQGASVFSHTVVAVLGVLVTWVKQLAIGILRGAKWIAIKGAASSLIVGRRLLVWSGQFGKATLRWLVAWSIAFGYRLRYLNWRKLLWPAVTTTILIGIGYVALAPIRTYMDQQESIARSINQARTIAEVNERLEISVARLETDAEVARIARQEYGLSLPGERSYALLRSPNSVTSDYASIANPSPSKSRSWLSKKLGSLDLTK